MNNGAVIAAAGMSTRMRQFKQLMKIGNIPLSKRVIMNFQRAGIKDIVVVTGYLGNELEKEMKDMQIVFLRNEDYRTTEMFDSVKIGLRYLKDRCDQVMFCPADVPFFTEKTVRILLKSRKSLAKPVYNGQTGHPIKISSTLIPDILRYKGNGGLKGALDSFAVDSDNISVDDAGTVIDADTKEDYERLIVLYNRRQPMISDGI